MVLSRLFPARVDIGILRSRRPKMPKMGIFVFLPITALYFQHAETTSDPGSKAAQSRILRDAIHLTHSLGISIFSHFLTLSSSGTAAEEL